MPIDEALRDHVVAANYYNNYYNNVIGLGEDQNSDYENLR